VVTSDTGNVTLSVATYSPGNGGTTQGVLALYLEHGAASAGVATFVELSRVTGTAAPAPTRLNAARGGFELDDSTNVVITAGAATRLVFSGQPSSGQNIQATGTGSFPVVSGGAGRQTVTSRSADKHLDGEPGH